MKGPVVQENIGPSEPVSGWLVPRASAGVRLKCVTSIAVSLPRTFSKQSDLNENLHPPKSQSDKGGKPRKIQVEASGNDHNLFSFTESLNIV